MNVKYIRLRADLRVCPPIGKNKDYNYDDICSTPNTRVYCE